MPDKTLTINHAGGGSETYTINRDKFEGIRNMTRKLGETAGDPQNITGFTASGSSNVNLNGTFTLNVSGWQKPNADGYIRYFKSGTQWFYRDYDGEEGSNNLISNDDVAYPWEITNWLFSQPTFGSFVGGSIGSAVTDTVSVDHTPADDLRNLLIDAQNITINRDEGEEIRTLFIDGVEVTIDRTGEVIVEGFLTLFPNAAAAYSLQRLNGHQALINARRGSDGVEVDVYPDNSNKREVSADSPITVTSGSSSATTFGEFLTEENDILDEPNFATDTGEINAVNASLTFNEDSVSDGSVSKDDCLEAELTSTSSAYIRDFGSDLFTGINNVKIRFEADVFAPSSNVSTASMRLNNVFSEINGGGSQVAFPDVKGSWTSVSLEGYPNQNALQIIFLDRTIGDVYYFANMKVTVISDNGYVTTWYDQAGSNDATQPLDDLQPKIAEAGNCLGVVDWDGGSQLVADNFGVTYGSGQTDFSAFWVSTPEGTSVDAGLIAASNGFIVKWESDNRGGFSILDGNNTTAGISGSTLGSAFVLSDNTRKGFVNGAASIDTTGTSSYNMSKLYLGFRGATGYGRTYKMKEVIIYSSDQSANRADIEANINERYSIY